MEKIYSYSLFEVFGVELEYMIVDKDSLKVKPIADQLLFDFSNNYSGDYENGAIEWSNELVAHVIELKVSKPVQSLKRLSSLFHENIIVINKALAKYNAMILPTAAHPTFDPFSETKLWAHEHNEIYELYNKIFDCKGHGWSNLQSVHINLPFKNEEEFALLHAAIRVVLPLIPGIAASSPILDGKVTGYKDSRMFHYLNNQKEIPSLMGRLIPEAAYTFEDYHKMVFNPIINDIKPYDSEGVMEHHFLNSRGAIARFDRGAIEIRVTDIQECPLADLAILDMIVALLKYIIEYNKSDIVQLKNISTENLAELFKLVIKNGEDSIVHDKTYLSVLGLDNDNVSVNEIWKQLCSKLNLSIETKEVINYILTNGTLSTRILKRFEAGESINNIYIQLAKSTAENKLFE